MKIRIELGSAARHSVTGVGHYARLLTEAIDHQPNIKLRGLYFNFLSRQPRPKLSIKGEFEVNRFIPQRLYTKLQSYNLAPPVDLLLPKVDLTIFPNFATWPTKNSRLKATVIHDLTYLHYPEVMEDANLAHLRRVVPRTIKKADFIITVSEAVKSELINEFGLKAEDCIVTPIPPDSAFFVRSKNDIHKKYKLPTKKFILFVGTLEPRKNIPTLIEAYCSLPNNLKQEYSLVLAGGTGWKTKASQDAINDAQKRGESIVQVGYVDQADSPAFYQKSSLVVLPSLYEGFGMQMLESMASQTPIVASDIPVLREVGSEAALYADPHRAEDFRDKMEDLLNSPKLRRELMRNSEKQLSKFSWDTSAQNIISHAEQLLKK